MCIPPAVEPRRGLIPLTRGMTYDTRAARAPRRQPGQELSRRAGARRKTCHWPSKQRSRLRGSPLTAGFSGSELALRELESLSPQQATIVCRGPESCCAAQPRKLALAELEPHDHPNKQRSLVGDPDTLSAQQQRLALAKLEPLAGALLPVLLALLDAGIAGEQALAFERLAEIGVEFEQGAGDAHLDRISLSADAAA